MKKILSYVFKRIWKTVPQLPTMPGETDTREAPWLYNPTVRWSIVLCSDLPSYRKICPVLSKQALSKGSFFYIDGFERKWARNGFETNKGWSFDFFSKTGTSQEASVFSTVFDDKNPFRAYNLMRIHTWTRRTGFERQLEVFIGWSTPAEPLTHLQKLKTDFHLRLLLGVFVAGLCSQLPAEQSLLLLTPGPRACCWKPSSWAQHLQRERNGRKSHLTQS